MSDVVSYIYGQCVNAGMTNEGICALLANLQAESNFKVNNLEDSKQKSIGMTDEEYTAAVDNGTYTNFVYDGAGYGLFQVTFYTRKRYFLDFVRGRKKSIGDLDVQVSYILWELKSMFPRLWNVLCSSHNLEQCTRELLYTWENPQDKERQMPIRLNYAQAWYSKFGVKGVTTKMTNMEAVSKVLNFARNEIGYHEQGNNNTKYAAFMDSCADFYNGPKNGFAWCDVFVDYLFVKCFGVEIGRQMICQPKKSAGAGCLYSAQYYKDAGRWVTQPQPGDQIFFSYSAGEYSHTGIVEAVANGTVTTIEGNTSDMVARRSYPIASGSIVGYGRPKWDLAVDAPADADVNDDADNSQNASSGYVTVIMRKGSKGIEVCKMQEKLLKLGYDLGRYGADGDFGNDTLKAVKQFQKDHGLEVDGEVGPLTSSAIEKALGNVATTTKASSIRPDPVTVVITPLEEEKPVENVEQTTVSAVSDEFKFRIGDIVNFVGEAHYFGANSRFGFKCKPGRAMVRDINKKAGVKHPYKVSAVMGFGSTVNGWVDADAIKAL